jgi:hypothetical protein
MVDIDADNINERIAELESRFWPLLSERGYDDTEVRRLAEELRALRRARNDEQAGSRDDPPAKEG